LGNCVLFPCWCDRRCPWMKDRTQWEVVDVLAWPWNDAFEISEVSSKHGERFSSSSLSFAFVKKHPTSNLPYANIVPLYPLTTSLSIQCHQIARTHFNSYLIVSLAAPSYISCWQRTSLLNHNNLTWVVLVFQNTRSKV
jgi:hypothetical protein